MGEKLTELIEERDEFTELQYKGEGHIHMTFTTNDEATRVSIDGVTSKDMLRVGTTAMIEELTNQMDLDVLECLGYLTMHILGGEE